MEIGVAIPVTAMRTLLCLPPVAPTLAAAPSNRSGEEASCAGPTRAAALASADTASAGVAASLAAGTSTPPAPGSPRALLDRLIGDAEGFSVEHRIANGIAFLGAVLSLPATASNVAMGLPSETIAVTAFASVAYAGLYYWSRCRRVFALPAVLSLLGLAVVYYPLVWLSNHGLDGSIHYMGLLGVVATSCLLSGWRRHAVSGLFVTVTALLLAGEFSGVLPVTPYPERNTRFLDVFASFLVGGLALAGIVLILKASLRREHQKALVFSDLVVRTNRDLERALAENERLARTDLLTTLPNRRHAEERLAQRLREAERYGRPFAVVLFDIDHFKGVNDRLGHAGGDAVLMELGRLLGGQTRDTDLAARWGGEEFVVLLPETPLDGALVMAERLRRAAAAHPFPGGEAVTVSLGVAAWRPGDTEDTLLARADAAAYEAKRAGRNRVVAG